ncbi:NAD/FAD-utilizing enzyme apparently involved in cell division [hydrothermal vent metagenome]|uniref:NAD/FAD-utilizing enzyme apparently involved in cell division n=1 Tax=hydrothermal vent metagenome TaxID=652676 RepID=A0A3B0Z0Z9_9ZZZZ
MRRLYFLLPDLDVTHKVVDELLLARVEERHIHIIAAEGVELGDLPEASLLQKSDFIPAMERGVALGGATGVLAGLAALALPGIVVAGGAILGVSLLGAGMGAWLGGMIGMDVENTRVKAFQSAIEKGEILVLVDVPRDRVSEIEQLVRKHHPDADFEGTEPTIPAFP